MSIFSKETLRIAALGTDAAGIDPKTFLHQMMVDTLRYMGGKSIGNTGGNHHDFEFSSDEAWHKLEHAERDTRIRESLRLEDDTKFYDVYVWALSLQMDEATAELPLMLITRDVLYKRYGLPAWRQVMTDEQKAIANEIDVRLREDSALRKEGKYRCLWTGIVSDLSPVQIANQKKLSKAKQNVINAVAAGTITMEYVRDDGTVDLGKVQHGRNTASYKD